MVSLPRRVDTIASPCTKRRAAGFISPAARQNDPFSSAPNGSAELAPPVGEEGAGGIVS